jgi:hypothetical protein
LRAFGFHCSALSLLDLFALSARGFVVLAFLWLTAWFTSPSRHRAESRRKLLVRSEIVRQREIVTELRGVQKELTVPVSLIPWCSSTGNLKNCCTGIR